MAAGLEFRNDTSPEADQAIVDAPLARRSTDDAVGRLTQPRTTLRTVWYEAGTDYCFYASAYEACKGTKARLRTVLLPEEFRILERAKGLDDVLEGARKVEVELARKASKSVAERRTGAFINGFCDFVVKASGIVGTLIPQSPEYTVTFGVLLIIFKTVVTKKEREETLTAFIQTMLDQLPLAEFYKDVYPTYDMKLAVASIYVGMTKLLEDALVYLRGGRLSKLLDATLRPKDGKFHQQIVEIERAIEKLNGLKTAAHIAQQSDMNEVLQDAGHVVARIHQSVIGASAASGISMALMDRKVNEIQTQTARILEFDAFRYTLLLRQSLLPDNVDHDEDYHKARSQKIELSPKDQWEENGILDVLLEWSYTGRDTLLWIGGASGSRDSWVTQLSLDMIDAFQGQGPTLIHTFCNSPSSVDSLTPRCLLKGLIVQLLTHHPNLAFQNPQLFNEYRFHNATTFHQLWKIFSQLVERVEELFIIIDRVEEIRLEEDENLSDHLLPSLVDLAYKTPTVSIIVTSVYEPPEVLEGERLTHVYIDTGKRPKQRE